MVGGPGKLLQKVSTAPMSSAPFRCGTAYSLVGSWSAANTGLGCSTVFAHSQPEHSVGTRGFGVVGMLVPAGNRHHTEQQHRDQRVDVRRRVAPIPDSLALRVAQAETPFGLARVHHAHVGGNQVLSKPAVTFLRRMTGTSKDRGLWSGVAGVRFSLFAKKDASTMNLHTGETLIPMRANPRLDLGRIVRIRRLACSSKFHERNRSQ